MGRKRTGRPREPRDRYLHEREAARLLGVTHRTLQKWRQRDSGPPYVRLTARCIRYSESAVIAWADSHTIEPASPQAAAS